MTAIESGQSAGVVEVTPSGIPVYYQSQPKRLYKVFTPRFLGFNFRGTTAEECNSELIWDAQNDPRSEWREVPSVSTVLDILEGPPVWWGMQVGIRGCIALADLGVLTLSGPVENPRLEEQIIEKMKEHELTTNDSQNKGATRGQSVHDALESWARHGHMPDPSIYPEEEEGYVRGLVGFLESIPSAEPVACEVMVASPKHGYAGRYDLRVRTYQSHEVVFHHTPVRGNQTRRLEPGEYLVDLKTSKDIMPKHSRQLEGYEAASIESGYEPTDGRGILHVSADGRHKFRRSWATFHDFKVVLDLWRSEQDMKARKKAA